MDSINPTSASSGGLVSAAESSQLSSENFLTLLVTQLQNQDPLNPTSNEDYLAQLAQFSQLEETQKQTGALEGLLAVSEAQFTLGGLSQGAALVGKLVDYLDPITGETRQGQVDSVLFTPEGVMAEIGGRRIPAGTIVGISLNPTTPEPDPTTDPTNSGNGSGTGGSNGNGGNGGVTPTPVDPRVAPREVPDNSGTRGLIPDLQRAVNSGRVQDPILGTSRIDPDSLPLFGATGR